ncbi:hypothetical protein C8F04DRAFT_1404766 [Mycena alexandri]|uniref:Uncharacterized protein n=1 Tax=Mycena alexandri TaxID=1745969 RepID=A0AAD6S4B9_9AGAR|nr:hypothetical protein C8F04DRAFT_1404766 [Mycena alexandri]
MYLGIQGRETLDSAAVSAIEWLQDTRDNLEGFRDTGSWLIFSKYLDNAARLDTLPYEYLSTVSSLDLRPMYVMITSTSFFLEPETHHVDEILVTLAKLWSTTRTESTLAPHAMLKYLSRRKSTDAVRRLVSELGMNKTWRGILNHTRSDHFMANLPPEVLEALWRLCALPAMRTIGGEILDEAISVIQYLPDSPTKISVNILLHARLLLEWLHPMARWRGEIPLRELYTRLSHSALPTDGESLFPVPPRPEGDSEVDNTSLEHAHRVKECLSGKIKEAYIRLLGDFFRGCGSTIVP